MSAREKLAAGIGEYRLHTEVFREARAELGKARFTADSIHSITNKDKLREERATIYPFVGQAR
uniref:Uncharacterized protein n=1 Tax=Candidatus Kentrum sp. DK TaxID=2126562 RepID=A0A450T5P2_9GAMM|nr:MAG: hypothetical protein BECKDK2373C_GA0170839_109313 [Candidatus Kentron sp. DK]